MLRTNFPDRLTDEFEAYVSDEAYIAACELCSPNSMEFEGVWGSRAENEAFRAQMLPYFLASEGFGMAGAPESLEWPVYAPKKVFHLGTMDPALKGRTHNAYSHEGNGLSISTHPDAWREIARLGGEDKWKLSRDQAKFLDIHSLEQHHRNAIIEWAEKQGLVETVPVARVSHDGDHPGEQFRSVMLFDMTTPKGRRDANRELADIPREDGPRINIVAMPRATHAMNDRAGFQIHLFHVADIAATYYVEDVLHESLGLDGIWWEDDMSPADLSAPRGVIHLSALPAWEVERVQDRASQRLCAA